MNTNAIDLPVVTERWTHRLWRTSGWWGFGLAAAYAILVRFYQAAGGTIGLAGEFKDSEKATFASANYLAGLLILMGGVACLYLGVAAVRRFPGWFPVAGGRPIPGFLLKPLCLVPVMAGAVFAVAHAVIGMVTKAMALLGLIEISYPDEWEWIDPTAMAWWDLLFYEPWFLALGVMMMLVSLRYLRDTGSRARTLRIVVWTAGFLVAAFATAGTVMVVTDTVWVV